MGDWTPEERARWLVDVWSRKPALAQDALRAMIENQQEAQRRIAALEAQVTRLQAVVRRWAQEDYPPGEFPGWDMIVEMHGLNPGDLDPLTKDEGNG